MGNLALVGSTSGTVTVAPAAVAGTWTMTLPNGPGTNGQLLQTNGSGVTSWIAAPFYPVSYLIVAGGGGGGFTDGGGGSDGTINIAGGTGAPSGLATATMSLIGVGGSTPLGYGQGGQAPATAAGGAGGVNTGGFMRNHLPSIQTSMQAVAFL